MTEEPVDIESEQWRRESRPRMPMRANSPGNSPYEYTYSPGNSPYSAAERTAYDPWQTHEITQPAHVGQTRLAPLPTYPIADESGVRGVCLPRASSPEVQFPQTVDGRMVTSDPLPPAEQRPTPGVLWDATPVRHRL